MNFALDFFGLPVATRANVIIPLLIGQPGPQGDPGPEGPSATIGDGSITNAKLANMPALAFKARKTNSTGAPENITATEATALLDLATGTAKGLFSAEGFLKLAGIAEGATANAGTVTSVAVTVPTGLTITGSPITKSGTLAIGLQSGYSIPTTAKQTEWDTAYTDRNKWDGGATGLTASTGRTSLGATTIGSALFTLANPGAVTFPRLNADNTVTALGASDFRTAIGVGTSSTTDTVTSVSVATANGVSGSVANASTTPAITIALGEITPNSVAATGNVTGANLSGTNTGDQTTITGNAGTATTLQTGRTISITGDLTWTSPTFNGSANVTAAGTLATVNSNVGTFGSTSAVPVITVNGKGLITGVTTAALGTMATQAASAVAITGGSAVGLSAIRVGASAAVIGEALTVVGGNGIHARRVCSLSSGPSVIAEGAAILMLMRDNNNGGTALVMYENALTPIIISQSGTNYTTGTPTGAQIRLDTIRPFHFGVQASTAFGRTTTLHVAIISADD